MDGDNAGPPDPVISQSANVVVQSVDSGYPTWNLAATVGGAEPTAEGEAQVAYISLSDDQLSLLTQDQFQKIGVSLPLGKPKPKLQTQTQGFETNETSQFNVVDVDQEDDEDDHNYLGGVLRGELPPEEGEIPLVGGEIPPVQEIPEGNIPSGELPLDTVNKVIPVTQPPEEPLQEVPIVNSVVEDSQSTITATEASSEETPAGSSSTATEDTALASPEGPTRRSARQSAGSLTKSEESEEGTMVRTNIQKTSVRTRGREVKTVVVKDPGKILKEPIPPLGEVGSGPTKEGETPPGFTGGLADHSYAGKGALGAKEGLDPPLGPEHLEGVTDTSNAGKKEGATTPLGERRSTRERKPSVLIKPPGASQQGSKQPKEATPKKGAASKRQTSAAKKKGRRSSKGDEDKAGPSGVTSDSGTSDSGRPKRASGRNFKVKDLGLASSDDEKAVSDEEDDPAIDGGSEWSEDEDPEKLWCICRKPYDSRFMICCDKCEDWFHGSCVNVTKSQGKHMEDNGLEWFCPGCKGLLTSTAKLKPPENHPTPDKRKRSGSFKKTDNEDNIKKGKRDTSRSRRGGDDRSVSGDNKTEKSPSNGRRNSRGKSKGETLEDKEETVKEELVKEDTKKEEEVAAGVQDRRTSPRERTKEGNKEEDVKDLLQDDHQPKNPEEGQKKGSVPEESTKVKPLDSPKVESNDSPKVKSIDSPKVESIDSPKVKSIDSPKFKQEFVKLGRQTSRERHLPQVKGEPAKSEEPSRTPEFKGEVKAMARIPKLVKKEEPVHNKPKHVASPRRASTSKIIPDHHKKEESPEATHVKKKKIAKPPLPKQKCIMTNCDNMARPNTIYCSNRCILRHAVESLQLLHQEKWFSQGFKRDSDGELKGRAHCEGDRVPVVEKHTNRLRTGLAAPTPEDLPSWLERHPTYEVLVPTVKTTPPPVVSPTSKHGRDPPKRLDSKERRKSESESKHPALAAEKSPVKQDPSPKQPRKVEAEKLTERRRSSAHHQHEGSRHDSGGKTEGAKQGSSKSDGAKPSAAEGVRQNVRKSLSECFCNRLKNLPEIKVTPEEATKTAHVIEEELFKLHKDTGMKYKAKYRTLIFNLRDVKNKGLFRRVVQNKIKPVKLVQMTSEQLASKELHEWREREAKHTLEMIVEVEKERKEVPIIIKTHKGEVEITEEDNLSTLQVNANRDSPVPVEMKSPESTPAATSSPTGTATAEAAALTAVTDTTEQHRSHLFDLNCKICTGRAAPPEQTSAGAKRAKVKRQVSKAEELEREEEEEARLQAARRLAKKELAEKKKGKKVKGGEGGGKNSGKKKLVAKVKEFVARTPPGTPPPTPPRAATSTVPSTSQKVLKSFWKGFLNMQDVAKFVAAAYHVSGPIEVLNELFPDSLEIRGRIPFTTVWDYFNKLHSVGSTEMTVLRFEVAHEEDNGVYGKLFKYFSTRERIGVVGFSKPLVKDFYILPLPSDNPIPPSILPFDGPGLPEKRTHMLLGLIIIHKDKARPPGAQISPTHTHVQPRQQKAKPAKPEPSKATGSTSKRPSSSNDQSKASKRVTIREPQEEEEKHYLPPVVKRIKSTDPDYVPESQMSDPIVAQYGGGGADGGLSAAEDVEPYSPSQEEREAPYDPTDVVDDLAAQNDPATMTAAALGLARDTGQTAAETHLTESEAYSPSHPTEPIIAESQQSGVSAASADVDKLNQLIQDVSGNIAGLGARDIVSAANVASDVSENLLSSLGESSDLSEQQQLLVQLTRQVEEAKKALLDKQIESLQSEISRATNQMATLQSTDTVSGPGVPFSDEEAAGVRKVPADSSTSVMNPMGVGIDQSNIGGGNLGPQDYFGQPGFGPMGPMGSNIPPLQPPPFPPWQAPGMPTGSAPPFPQPPPPGMMGPEDMGPGNMGPGWGPGAYNGP